MFGRNYSPPIAHKPATPFSYGPSPLTPQAQHRTQLWHALARALNKRPRRRQQQQPNHDRSYPPVYEPGIVPQPAGRALVVMTTSTTCPPCRLIEPVFEELARAKAKGQRVAFVKVDLGVRMGMAVAREFGVAATSMFDSFSWVGRWYVCGDCLRFLEYQCGLRVACAQIHDLKGVNAPEMRTQVDLLYQAFPRKLVLVVRSMSDMLMYEFLTAHPRVPLEFPSISSLSTEPILFAQVPALNTVQPQHNAR